MSTGADPHDAFTGAVTGAIAVPVSVAGSVAGLRDGGALNRR